MLLCVQGRFLTITRWCGLDRIIDAGIRMCREEGAETLIEQMVRDQDPIIRYGGMFVIGLAYRGTANNGAIQKLLHFAVSDVSDDIRRAAVMNLGFVLLNVPEQAPRIVSLLVSAQNF